MSEFIDLAVYVFLFCCVFHGRLLERVGRFSRELEAGVPKSVKDFVYFVFCIVIDLFVCTWIAVKVGEILERVW